ncbi:MAG: hypothetical protein V3571_15535 [Pseudodesulfovibrio sp.]
MEISGFEVQSSNVSDQTKSIRKARLQREVLADPEMARELVKIESTGTYNAKGTIIQSVGNIGAA